MEKYDEFLEDFKSRYNLYSLMETGQEGLELAFKLINAFNEGFSAGSVWQMKLTEKGQHAEYN